ncbi:hypothetical protein FE257_007482 [Aspergillus nanangensis]|uniref:Uncharacterized protein n=1 Tax=Aspergillus nanangensis TaxID=2582783 RepID=A0AAD4CN62_ASPNN|nr:hypothetical protein FE257_007482 [Aspergillus nanangensis]
MKDKPTRSFFHLEAPTIMVLSLTLGIIFMVGHYFFYNRLNNQPAPDSGYRFWTGSLKVSGQQVNIAAGSIFALLVKTGLGAAITTALDQSIWKKIRTQPTQIALIDDMVSLPTTAWSLTSLQLWRSYPLGALIGVFIWLLPVISVITPATLTVRATPNNHTQLGHVPQVDFASLKFANFLSFEKDSFTYDSPQIEVKRIVESVTIEGEILSVTPPFPNSSWHLDFHGPALNCHLIDQVSRDLILQNVQENNNCSSGSVYGYLSWTRTAPNYGGRHAVDVEDSIVPFDSDNSLEPATLGPDAASTSPLTLYVAAFPGMPKRTYVDSPSDPDNCPANSTFVQNATIVECILQNASYSGNFTFTNGAQRIESARQRYLNEVSYMGPATSSTSFDTPEHQLDSRSDLETIAYQAILDAFDRLLQGSIALVQTRNPATPWGGPTLSQGLQISGTSVMSTVIGTAPELEFILDYMEGNGSTSPFGNMLAGSRSRGQNLPSILEQVFENITFSMMSPQIFQYNHSSPLAPAQVPILVTRIENLYVFSWSVLVIAYGIALLFSLSHVGFGLLAYFSSGGSYSSKFSTVLRTTRRAGLSSSIEPSDESGKNPLPRYIAESTISMVYSREHRGHGVIERERQPYFHVSETE